MIPSPKTNRTSNSIQKKLHLSSSASFLPITPNSKNITTFFSPKKTLPYNEYSNLLQVKMKKYRANSPIYLDNTEENNKTLLGDSRFVTKDEEKFIKKIYSSNHSFFGKGLSPTNEEASLKISIPNNADYVNPIHSLGVLKSNNLIYDDVTKKNLSRQIGVFDNSIRNFEAFTMKYKTKMPKIRITSLLPKYSSSIPVIDQTDNKKKRESMLAFVGETFAKNKLFAYYRYPNKNFPETREQFSLVNVGGRIILVGGMCSVMQTTFIWSLDVLNLTWKRIQAKNMSYNRFGHTCVCYQNKLFIYGGRTKFNSDNKETTDLLNGLDYFNLDDNIWYSPAIPSKNAPRPRRNHIAEIIGSQMIIHGGINENEEILDGCHLLNLSNPLKWIKVSISSFMKGPCCYGHAAALVVPLAIRNSYRFSIYKYPDNTVTKTNSLDKIKEVGWYIFGGKTKEEGGLSNDLWVLCLGKKPLEWKKIEDDKGQRPSPRYYHSMNYYEDGNFLIIHGGRNDEQSDSFALNDTYLFDLEQLEWTRIELYSQLKNFKILSRCGHSAVVFSNKMIVFGGMNSNNYIGSALLIVNLDWEYSTKFKTAEEIMIEKIKNDRKMREKNKDKKKRSFEEEEEEENKLLEKLERLHNAVNKNQLGIVANLDLPPIK